VLVAVLDRHLLLLADVVQSRQRGGEQRRESFN
jgi:hypothetical protein